MLETEDTVVVYSSQPWSEAGPQADGLGRVPLSILSLQHSASYLSGRHCLCWRLRILLWYTLPNNHGLRLGLGLRLGSSALSITT